MHFYIARQPIFDKLSDIIAYELLYRDSDSKTAHITDADIATLQVIMGSTLIASFDELVNNKRAFINFTKNLILNDTPEIFPYPYITVEILEDIIPDAKFIHKLKDLKDKGYTLALDDFTLDYKYKSIIDLVDILKVDFIQTTPDNQLEIINTYKRPGLKFLAEKIETINDFNRAKAIGYDYFQGYYFSKPSILKYKDINSISASHCEMVRVLNEESPTFTDLAQVVETDVSLTYKLFKYANSPIFGGAEEITTVKNALVRLGLSNIKKWIYLVVLRALSTEQSDELVAISLQRAKMLEQIALKCNLYNRSHECFLVGLFSMLDIFMGKPIETVLEEIPLAKATKEAIIYKENDLGQLLKLSIAYEKGNWSEVERISNMLKINSQNLSDIYFTSIKWASDTIKFAC
ncbi:MAG: EAL and HDOD domain-containing protein [Aminipila sp.]